MPATVDLLRHGDTGPGGRYLGRTDVPLSDAGWMQLRSLAAAHHHWQRIVSSPLQRCAAFARELADARRLPLTLDERWQEMDFGAWENRLTGEIMENDPDRLRRFWENPLHHSPPDGENLRQVSARVLAAWQDCANGNGATLVVTHGGPIRILLCLAQQHPLTRLLDINVPLASLHRADIPADSVPP